MTIQAILTRNYTTAITFTGRPNEELRKNLQASGFKFDKGRWFRTETQSVILDEATVAANLGS